MQNKIKCFYLLAFLLTSTTFISISAQPLMKPPASTIEIEIDTSAEITFSETNYDFGAIEEGTLVTQVYTFTNTGSEPLILVDAKGSCGCTVPEWPKEPILPGETASLTVQFNSKNKRGKRNQKITITTNTSPPQTFLYLSGTIIQSEESEEPGFDFQEPETPVRKKENCFAIYPNPTAEVLSLQMNDYFGKDAIISILSDKGQLMAKRKVNVIEGTVEFRVDHYPAGTYYAKVQVAGQQPESRCFVVVD